MELCLVMDGHYGICNQPLGHNGVIHKEVLESGELWAEWRSITPADEKKRAKEYLPPRHLSRWTPR